MSLKNSIQEAMKNAMRAQDKARLSAIRLMMADIKKYEIDNREDITDEQTLTILNKMLKQRRDAAKQYQDAKRDDLADKENFEIGIIQTFLPEQLSADELKAMVTSTIAELGADSMKDMGKIMGALTAKTKGRADMTQVSQMVKELLS
jgi:uncharacterized protein